MFRFVIPVQWVMTAEVEVEAATREAAIAKVMGGALPIRPATYLEDSFVVNDDASASDRASLLSSEIQERR